jgi:hypothetical protein
LRRHKPGRFDTFLFADYSGAVSEAAQRRAIALFRMEAGAKRPTRVTGPFTRASLREAIVHELEGASKNGQRVLFGIDHQWSWPTDVLLAAGLSGRPWRKILSLLVEGQEGRPPLGPAATYARAFNAAVKQTIFYCRVKSLASKYGVPCSSAWSGDPVRFVERLMQGAKPATRLGGVGAVAGQTLAGLLELHTLVKEIERRGLPFRAWPFDTLHDDGSSHIGCEIYPGHCKRELGERGRAMTRPDWSEHERDAALTCLWANEAPLASLMDLRKAPIEARTMARIEGWILGARPATGGL